MFNCQYLHERVYRELEMFAVQKQVGAPIEDHPIEPNGGPFCENSQVSHCKMREIAICWDQCDEYDLI